MSLGRGAHEASPQHWHGHPTRVLVVEDNPAAFRLMKEMLALDDIEMANAQRLVDALHSARSEPPDVALLDLGLPDASGLEALTKLRAHAPALPIVVVTAADDEATVAGAARSGADDYLVKGQFERDVLVRSLRHAVERRRALEAVRVSEARYRSVVEMAGDAIVVANGEGLITDWNAAAERLFGHTADEVRGQPLEMLMPASLRPAHTGAFGRSRLAGETRFLGPDRELHGLARDGREFPIEIVVSGWRNGSERFFSAIIRDLSEQERVLRRLQRAEARYESTRDAAVHGFYRSSPAGEFLEVNPALVSMLDYASEADLRAVGVPPLYANPHERSSVVSALVEQGHVNGVEVDWLRRDGQPIAVRLTARSETDSDGGLAAFEVFVEDVSRERMLAMQLRQSKKLEEMGRIAGGVAHDFNNVLGVILGYGELLVRELAENSSARRRADEMTAAARRAARLTRQLLAFGRRQVLSPELVDLSAVAGQMETMLGSLVGEDVDFVTKYEREPWSVLADPSQLEQIVLNLVTNASQAMPRGGTLIVETRNVELDARYADGHVDAQSGEHVLLAVSDSGEGMDRATLSRVFEPFFTTKESGEGTGLGLATVYGIVKQSGGHITAYSEPGRGTTFKVYLPRAQRGEARPKQPEDVGARTSVRSETILLVEDDTALREMVLEVLQAEGYDVHPFGDAVEAVEAVGSGDPPIHLVLTDVVMPKLSGAELVDELRRAGSTPRVIYMSGYTQERIARRGELADGVAFIEKPFTATALLAKISEVLART